MPAGGQVTRLFRPSQGPRGVDSDGPDTEEGQGVDDQVERVILTTDVEPVGKALDHAHDGPGRGARIDGAGRPGDLALEFGDAGAEVPHKGRGEEPLVVLPEEGVRC